MDGEDTLRLKWMRKRDICHEEKTIVGVEHNQYRLEAVGGKKNNKSEKMIGSKKNFLERQHVVMCGWAIGCPIFTLFLN